MTKIVEHECRALDIAVPHLSVEPGRAIVGLKNHGLTITGPSLDDIFTRIEPVIETQIPMTA